MPTFLLRQFATSQEVVSSSKMVPHIWRDNMNKNTLSLYVIAASMLAYTSAHASCGSAFCSINTNWDEHSLGHQGWSADLRYSYSHANKLRSGSDTITADTSADGEVENLGTYNRITTLTLDYTYNDRWGVKVAIPYIDRKHEHNLGPYTGSTPAGYESFHANALGDIKLVGRYRWSLDQQNNAGMGVKFGLKLATGKQNVTIDQTGEVPEEVTLQPGNGSTDLILGMFWHQAVPGSDWSWFAQGSLQASVQSDSNFRPGNQIKFDVGTRYAVNHDLSALLQINAQRNSTDSGDSAAMTEDGDASSGGKTLSLSPGLIYAVAHNTQLYGVVQLPVYQYVNGEQLTPNSSFTVGMNHRF
jgi:hypothetical protein